MRGEQAHGARPDRPPPQGGPRALGPPPGPQLPGQAHAGPQGNSASGRAASIRGAEKHAVLLKRRQRAKDPSQLAQVLQELQEVDGLLVGKKIAERLPVMEAAKSTTAAAADRVEKARRELEEASRNLTASLPMQGGTVEALRR